MDRDTGVPMIFDVLTTDTLQQALERLAIKTNLGWSYGLQAMEIRSLLAALPCPPEIPGSSQRKDLGHQGIRLHRRRRGGSEAL